MPVNPTSVLALVNYALAKLGQAPAGSLTSSDAKSLQIQQIYDIVRRDEMARHDWNFALREQRPPQLASPPSDFTDIYLYAYKKPQDSLKIIGLFSMANYQVYDDTIYTNDSAPQVLYTAEIGIEFWPAWFTRALGTELAFELALPLTEDETRESKMRRQADVAWAQAKHTDSTESSPLRLKYAALLNRPVKYRFNSRGGRRDVIVVP